MAEDRNTQNLYNIPFFWTLWKYKVRIDILLPLSVDQTHGYLIIPLLKKYFQAF